MASIDRNTIPEILELLAMKSVKLINENDNTISFLVKESDRDTMKFIYDTGRLISSFAERGDKRKYVLSKKEIFNRFRDSIGKSEEEVFVIKKPPIEKIEIKCIVSKPKNKKSTKKEPKMDPKIDIHKPVRKKKPEVKPTSISNDDFLNF